MKTLTAAMSEALKGPVTTICSVWIITRTDGVRIGLTDHDHPLTVDGLLCDPTEGADRTGLEASLGTNSDTANLTGVLSSAKISPHDVRDELFDDARLEHYAVNWQEPDVLAKLRTFTMGEIRQAGDAFLVELRGAAGLLSRRNGRLYARSCAARFCDTQCGLSESGFAHQTNIIGHPSAKTIQVERLTGIEPRRFEHGLVRFPGGGPDMTIESVALLGNAMNLSLCSVELPEISIPEPVTLIEGCDRSFAACRDRFNNAVNFRGFPHLPGNYQILNYLDEETRHDGEPIVP